MLKKMSQLNGIECVLSGAALGAGADECAFVCLISDHVLRNVAQPTRTRCAPTVTAVSAGSNVSFMMHALWNLVRPVRNQSALIFAGASAGANACAFVLFRMHALWNVLRSIEIESMPSVPARGAGTYACATQRTAHNWY